MKNQTLLVEDSVESIKDRVKFIKDRLEKTLGNIKFQGQVFWEDIEPLKDCIKALEDIKTEQEDIIDDFILENLKNK